MNTITSKKHYLTSTMEGFRNFFNTSISSVEAVGTELHIEMWVNPITEVHTLVDRVDTTVIYNLEKDTFKIKVKGKGSRKYGQQIKQDVTGIINWLVEEADRTYRGDVADAVFMTQTYAHDELKQAGYGVATLNEVNCNISHCKLSVEKTIELVEKLVSNAKAIENEEYVNSAIVTNQDPVAEEVPAPVEETKYFLTTGVVFDDTDRYGWAERGWIMEGKETDIAGEYLVNNPLANVHYWELMSNAQVLEISKEDYDNIYKMHCVPDGWGEEETNAWYEYTERLLNWVK